MKRYLLVLAGRNSSHQVDGAGSKGQHHEHSGQAKGLAATRLSELLATKTSDMWNHTFTNGRFLRNVIASPPLRRSLQLESRCQRG